uniref:Serpin domain-containing protein n=1 Tax=Maylandia zebra TaxID=106582 RepID=A0A3P9CJT2_9CICH
MKTVDFIGAPEACRAEINSWVEQQTESENVHLPQPEQQGIILASSVDYNEILLFRYFLSDKIKDLLKPGTVNADTRLALVNAVYFKVLADLENIDTVSFRLKRKLQLIIKSLQL